MLRKNLVYLALFCLLTLMIGCEHKDIEIEELSDEQIVPTASTIIGKQLENPYSIKNMKKALMELENESGLKSANTDEFEIETTHLYVRFLPKTEEQLNTLKKDTLLNIFDYPLDYEILKEGLYYHDPSLPDSSITWQYTVVRPDYNFPDIDYEVLSELFIIEESEDSVEVSLKSGSISASSWLALEDKAL